MAEVLIVFNPASRRGKRVARAAAKRLGEFARGRSIEWVALSDLERASPPSGRLVALGGDGTVNAVATWRRRREVDCAIGIVPGGTGNNLATGLGIPIETDAALATALDSDGRMALDAGLYVDDSGAERLFVQSAGIGFPADIAQRFDDCRRHRLFRFAAAPLGTRVYSLLAFLGLRRLRRAERRGERLLRLETEIARETIDVPLLALCLGNERSLGGDFIPCPKARVDDGLIDFCLLPAGTGQSYVRLLRKASRGEHLGEPGVRYFQSAGPIELRFSEPTRFLADGDLWTTSARYRIEALPACASIVVPARAAAEPPPV